MKILAGLSAPSLTWESLLTQEGLPWKVIGLHDPDIGSTCSVLVVVHPLDSSERDAVAAYLRQGGGVIGAAQHLASVAGISVRRERLDFLLADGDDLFRSVGLVDLALFGAIPREANHLRTRDNMFALFAGALGGGFVVAIPFDIRLAQTDIRTATKAFPWHRERLPSEHVSLVAKGEVRHLVRHALEYVHHARGIPYVHLWYFPSGSPNILAFRIDTDGAPRSDIDTLYRLTRECGVGATWFVDVGSHETWLPHFGTLTGQEIGLHCYKHRVSSDPDWNRRQWTRGRDLLAASGIPPRGFAAPFGTWTPALGAVIDELGVSYSSEFSCAYDTLPLYPEVQDAVFRTLQVPVHPISIGSLRRIGATEAQMAEYFRSVVTRKLSRYEPLFFYHHPSHRQWEVVRHLLEDIRGQEIPTMTLGDYADWWQRRGSTGAGFTLDEGMLTCEHPGDLAREQVSVRISRADGTEAVVDPVGQMLLSLLPWRTAPVPEKNEDLRRTREIDPRRLLGDLYTAMLRRLR